MAEVIVELKDVSSGMVNKRDKFLETPLHCAAKSKDKDTVELLLEHGADVQIIASKNRSVLHCLLESNEQDTNEQECLEILKMLLSKGAPVKIIDSDGQTLLHLAARNRLKDVILFLMPVLSNSVDKVDAWGNTPLHILLESIADRDGHNEKYWIGIVESMLKYKPSLMLVTDKRSRTVLHIAAKNKQKEIVKVLLTYSQ